MSHSNNNAVTCGQTGRSSPAQNEVMTTIENIPVTDVSTTTVRAACAHDCPDTCAMLVTVEDGKATEVRGDPDHPFTRGGLCVKVNNYQDKVYSADRLLHPMRRSGPKGSGEFEQISWDDALDEIADRFKATIAQHGPESVMPVSYLGTQGILNGLNVGDPLFNALGATITERTYCDSGACTAYTMTIGATAGVDPESLVHSRYIIIWACNMLSTNLHLWPFVAEAQRRGAKVVVIDPMRHRTAKHADWHIPIRPGTDGALALAMMHVIINEGLTDEAYVRDHTVGYADLVGRVQQYTPEWAEGETGIPAEDIRTLAREYATSEPSMIRIGVAIERHAGGGQTVRAIACLPALVGAWRKVGGGLLQLPLWAFPVNWGALMHPELATAGTRVINQFHLGLALTGEMQLDPPINALMVYNSNPLVVCPDQDKLVAGLSRDDLFTVVSDHFLTDTARYADIVLPATTQLEQHDIMFSWGHFYVSLNTPAVEPLGEAVSNTELFRRLAARMGLTDPCFTRTDEQMMAEAFDWLAPAMEGITLESLRETGWARLNLPGPDEFAPHAEGHFPTPSGKTEFRSSIAETAGNFVVPLFRQGCDEFQVGGEVDPLPHYIRPRGSGDAGYPLNHISPKSHAFLNSSAGDQPKQLSVQGEQTVILHPRDADERGIISGQYVRVFNERGRYTARAQVSPDIAVGVVISPMGGWRKNARDESTVNAVNPVVFADLGNAPTFSDSRVEIERI
jgi:anaerobic selenocysteine-containing dehydrogenase